MTYIDDFRSYWQQKTRSGHRDDSPLFYSKKAAEHASLMSHDDRTAGAVDLGTGAGELLEHLIELVTVHAATDFSGTILAKAKARVGTDRINFREVDAFDYLATAPHAVWIASASLNQYLGHSEQAALLDIFRQNPSARAIYYFDTVDPIRYLLLMYGILGRYPATHHRPSMFKNAAKTMIGTTRMLATALRPGLRTRHVDLGRSGFAFYPQFWTQLSSSRGLLCEITSSRYYEYRYHVTIRKP